MLSTDELRILGCDPTHPMLGYPTCDGALYPRVYQTNYWVDFMADMAGFEIRTNKLLFTADYSEVRPVITILASEIK